ncbi:MAG: FliH/SctL family protein [Bacillota bacterium]
MSKIFKSSYVTFGDKVEIAVNTHHEEASEIVQEESVIDSVDVESIIREKIKQVEEFVDNKIKEANEQAQSIINDAYEDSKKIYENAKTEGYEQGRTEGFLAGKAEAESIIQEALEIKDQWMEQRKNLAQELEPSVVNLIIQITEKILNSKIEDSYTTILNLVKLALDKCTFTETLILRVNPEDYGYVITAKDKILCLTENIDDIQIKQDPSLKRGSCILDTTSGSIDASIETQFNQIAELFSEMIESE